jgi:hypothetical protein
MPLSVLAPIDIAIGRTKRILFGPFHLEKWLKLGFCAFLSGLGNCGGNASTGWNNKLGERQARDAKEWLVEHLEMVVVVGTLLFVVGLGVWLTLIWLQSRGRLMFLDGVVRDRGAVAEPWREYRREGNSLFRFSALLNVASMFLGLAAIGLGLALAWPDIDRWRFDDAALTGLLAGGCSLVLVACVIGLIEVFLNDFVVPAMYARRVRVGEAWRIVSAEVIGPNLGPMVFYVLMKIGIALVTGILALALVCGTLCIACCLLFIPYVGTVLLLPFLVFNRCYSLAFLEQLGERWVLAGTRVEPAPEESGW